VKNILIVAPAFNEAQVLPAFIDEVSKLREQTGSQLSVRLLVVDDGSTDGTIEVLRQAAERNPGVVRYLSFSSNFGHQSAVVAGLTHIGDWPDAVITMDSDLEHPLSLIPRMVEAWQAERAVLVNTRRLEARSLGFTKRLFSRMFYVTTARLTGLDLVPGQADYRLWDAVVLRGLIPYLPSIGAMRVFAAWLPGKKVMLDYEQKVQPGRKSRFSFRKNVEFWIMGVIRFSKLPLQAISFLGGVGLLFSAVYGTYILVEVMHGRTVQGWASTLLTVMLLSCLQLLSVGIVASYLRRLVFAKDLPMYVIREASPPSDPGRKD
jgi:dolichol-phosphate mannosyltransferase